MKAFVKVFLRSPVFRLLQAAAFALAHEAMARYAKATIKVIKRRIYDDRQDQDQRQD